MIPASFFDKIKDKDGFAVIYQNKLRYSADSTVSDDAFDTSIDECLDSFVENRINFQSHSVNDGDAVVLVMGEPVHTEKEYRLLESLLKQSKLTLEDSIISSLTGVSLVVIPQKSSSFSYDFTNWIKEKTRGFIGRTHIIKQIDDFIAENPRGYITISAKPGMGKTSLAAKLIQQRNYIHHFNIRPEGINKSSYFLRGICEQLISRYDLDYPVLPSEATENSNFLSMILGKISENLKDENLVIVADSLDEVDDLNMSPGVNTLFLPTSLPDNVYVIATMREGSGVTLQIDCENKEIRIDANSPENKKDIEDHILDISKEGKFQHFILSQKIDAEFFVHNLSEKSEGNFMYLHYVLSDIEQGIYDTMESIPSGLEQYYEQHWQLMKGRDKDAWFAYKIPVLVALTVTRKPISVESISNFSQITQRTRVREVLDEWKQFLYESTAVIEGIQYVQYRLYHDNFHDFIAGKDQVQDEMVDLKQAERKIVNSLMSDKSTIDPENR